MGGTDPLRRHRPGDAVPRLVLANEPRPIGGCRRDLDEQPERPGAHRRPVRRHHLPRELAAGDHDGLRRAGGRRGQSRRCDGSARGRPVHRRRASGGVGQDGDLRRRRALDRRHRRGAGRGQLARQVPRRRRRRGARCRRCQPGAVHRGGTPSHRIQFVTGRGGLRHRDRLVSGHDAAQPGQRGVGGGAAGVAAGHPPGAEGRCRAEGSDLPAGDHHAGEDRVAQRSVGSGERGGRQLRPREAARRRPGRARPPDRAQPGQGADREDTGPQPKWRRCGRPGG